MSESGDADSKVDIRLYLRYIHCNVQPHPDSRHCVIYHLMPISPGLRRSSSCTKKKSHWQLAREQCLMSHHFVMVL